MKTMFMILLGLLFTTMVVAMPDIKMAEDINLGENIMSGGNPSINMMERLGDIKHHPEISFNSEIELDDLLDEDENIVDMNLETLSQFEEQEEVVMGVEEPAKEDLQTSTRCCLCIFLLLLPSPGCSWWMRSRLRRS